MGRNPQETKPQEPASTEQAPPQLIADRDTMTMLGVTFGEVIDAVKQDQDANKATIEALNSTVSEKNTAIDLLTAEVAGLNLKLSAQPKSLPLLGTGLQRLPNGGMRFTVDLDRDESLPLLDQAEGAGEDPAEYLRKTVKESLLVYTS